MADLYHDELFGEPEFPIRGDDALALSEPMRRYLATKLMHSARYSDRRRQLVDALYSNGELRLDYDSGETRTAAQAFEFRSGNCLSLVMMTAAFAKEMGLTVRYQVVLGEETWDRTGDTYILVGHVNLSLDERRPETSVGYTYSEPLIVDFVPSTSAQNIRTRVVSENSIIAMFSNNRAVESLTAGRLDTAYWWAREAIRQDPEITSSYLTLAVIYRRRHRPDLATQVLGRLLVREPENIQAMRNQLLALRDSGQIAEAEVLAQQLTKLDPHPPFDYFLRGQAAMREGRFSAARDLFASEIRRAPYHHEFHFWLAIACLQLNDTSRAIEELRKAAEVSTTPKDRQLYAGKRERLEALNKLRP